MDVLPPPPPRPSHVLGVQASKRVAEAETALTTASNSLDEARAENEALRDELERARQQQIEATEALETVKQAAQEIIAELESAIQETHREQTLSKERVERRLRRFKLAIDEEEQDCRVRAILEKKGKINRGHVQVQLQG